MRSNVLSVAGVALLVVACSGTAGVQSTAGAPTATTQQTSAQVPASSGTAPGVSPLEGTWATGQTTCAQQNAALRAAGFTAAQLASGGWDSATCGGMSNGTAMKVRFQGDELVVFQDGISGWDGKTAFDDGSTFQAGDAGHMYLTYRYRLDGDRLIVDMLSDDFAATSPAELLGEQIAQTVIWESAPFVRDSAAGG